MRRARTHRNSDKTRYRWYNDFELPEHLGGGTITVRLHGTDDDVRRKINRIVRPMPTNDSDFAQLYRRRNDAESINHALDDTLFIRRAHPVGHERQQLKLLTYALTVNSLAVHGHGRSTSDPPDMLAA